MVHPTSPAKAARHRPGCGQPGRISRLGPGGVYFRAVYLGFGRKCDADYIIQSGVRPLLFLRAIAHNEISDTDWKSLHELTNSKHGWFNKYLWKRHWTAHRTLKGKPSNLNSLPDF